MRTAIVGLGKIGLPLAVHYAWQGNDVVGVDISETVVRLVNEGVEPFPGEADLDVRLPRVVASGKLRATTEHAEAISTSEVVIVVVPLIVDEARNPDFSLLDAATASIGTALRPGTLVIYETTMPVGVTRGRWAPMLERASGLVAGADFHVAFSPERVLTGRVFADLRRYPKIVGALDHEGARRTVAFYESSIDFEDRPDLPRPNGVWDLGTAEAAELTKLAETTYRDVNIALANQFALFADTAGLDVHAVIDAANSQPYSHIHRPGISVGGHCIPVYPHLYLHGDPSAELVRTARGVNRSMPAHAIELLAGELGPLESNTIAVLGITYRPGVKETAFSGAFDVVRLLESAGARAVVSDPLYADDELAALGFIPRGAHEAVDGAIIHTDHDVYRALDVSSELPGCEVLVDGRGTFTGTAPDATKVRVIGRP